jgi:hypothetical protein
VFVAVHLLALISVSSLAQFHTIYNQRLDLAVTWLAACGRWSSDVSVRAIRI